jgi:hypothetical protein
MTIDMLTDFLKYEAFRYFCLGSIYKQVDSTKYSWFCNEWNFRVVFYDIWGLLKSNLKEHVERVNEWANKLLSISFPIDKYAQ